jgi:hypothetical protein
MTEWLIGLVHWLCGAVVLAEALNKLERIDLYGPHSTRQKIGDSVQVLAWGLLALGSAGAIIRPLAVDLIAYPSWQDVCVIAGCAALIIRARIKEK